MAGTLPPKLRTLLDTLRYANLPGALGEDVRAQIDHVEAEVTEMMRRLQQLPPEAP